MALTSGFADANATRLAPRKGAGNHLVSSSDSGPTLRRFPLPHKELLPDARCCGEKNDQKKKSGLPDTGPDARRSRGTACGLQPPESHVPSTATEGEAHPTSLWGSGIPPVLTHRLLPPTQKIEPGSQTIQASARDSEPGLEEETLADRLTRPTWVRVAKATRSTLFSLLAHPHATRRGMRRGQRPAPELSSWRQLCTSKNTTPLPNSKRARRQAGPGRLGWGWSGQVQRSGRSTNQPGGAWC